MFTFNIVFTIYKFINTIPLFFDLKVFSIQFSRFELENTTNYQKPSYRSSNRLSDLSNNKEKKMTFVR